MQHITKLTSSGFGSRIVNYFIDGFLYYFLILTPISFIAQSLTEPAEEYEGIGVIFMCFIIVGSYISYYTFFEHLFQRTPGKFVTRTIVVNNNGEKPQFTTILARSFGRLLPFDRLSYLFMDRGIHDRVSRTFVVEEKKLQEF